MKKQALLAVAASALFSVGAQAQFVIDEFAVNQATVADGTASVAGPLVGALDCRGNSSCVISPARAATQERTEA